MEYCLLLFLAFCVFTVTLQSDVGSGGFCEPIGGGTGLCRPLPECPPLVELLKDRNANNLRTLRQALCGYEGNSPKVCCPSVNSARKISLDNPGLSSGEENDRGTKNMITQLPAPPECGTSNGTGGRVVNGVDAKLGDFPWMALLGYKERQAGAGPRWLCGGSLVTRRHVLTAAHCVHGREDDLYIVRLGELDVNRDDDGASPVDILIKQKMRHKDYNPNSVTNDIALLLIERDAPLSWLIKPICLPTTTELRLSTFEKYQPFIAGWGETQFRGNRAPHLQVVQLPVVTNEFCENAYSAYKDQIIDHRVLCAGLGKGDSCQGDSGGPLMQPIVKKPEFSYSFYQIGVISFGKKCAEPGFPGVYTRVTEYIPWIERNIVGLNL